VTLLADKRYSCQRCAPGKQNKGKLMKEEEASLMILQHAIDKLEADKKKQVMNCVAAIQEVMQRFEAEEAGLALMLVAAQVAAE
jgi:hypothetical protein